MEYQNRKTHSSPRQPSKPSNHSSPSNSKHLRQNNMKPASISIFRAEEFDSNIESALKVNQNYFSEIFPNLKINEPTPTFPEHQPNDMLWDDPVEEEKNSQSKNRKISDFDEFGNISVIEKENISGIGGLSGDIPAFFDLKNSGEQNENSSEVLESKVEVMVCMNDLNTSSFVIQGSLEDVSILPENNVTIIMGENPAKTHSSHSKEQKKIKIKSVKIGKILRQKSSQLTPVNLKVKHSSNHSISKLRLVSESKSSINIKSSNQSLVQRPSLMALSSKKLLPKMKSKQVFSSTSKAFSPLALSLTNTPYLQEFKKTVLTSLIPSKKSPEEVQGLNQVKKQRKKKRIQIF